MPERPHVLALSTDAATADLWHAFAERYAARGSRTDELLRTVLDADPDLAVAHAVAVLLAALDGADFDPASEVAAARRGRRDQAWERSLVEAVVTGHTQGLWAARPSWVRHQQRHPGDLVGLQVAVLLTYTSSDVDAASQALDMVRGSARVLGEHPVLLGLEAMHAQDHGDLDTGHALATRALELDPTGFPGGHPLAHVFFESGDHDEGIRWLDAWLPTTDQEAPFGSHLVWHSALHHLAVGDTDGALDRYHRCTGRDGPGGVVDGTSLLWRCQLHGLVAHGSDPAARPVVERVRPLVGGVTSTFVGVHVALGLATAGDADGLRRLAAGAASFAAPGAADLLPGLARALAAYVEGDHARASDLLLAQEPHVRRYGGSHAQREVFEDTLLQALVRAGRHPEAVRRLQARLERRESPLDDNLLARVTRGG